MTSLIRTFALTFLFVSPLRAADPALPTGLNVEFFDDLTFSRPVVTRIDPNIDYHWARGKPVTEVKTKTFGVRWTGWIKAPLKGQYNFVLQGEDGVRLVIGGETVIDEPKLRGGLKSVAIEMSGEPQPILVEYRERDAVAWVTLRWNLVGQGTPQIIPTEFLFPTKESAEEKRPAKPIFRTGLAAEYFDTGFKKRVGVERVHRTEAIWADEPPMPGLPYDAGARYTGFLVPAVTGRYKFTGFADNRLRVAIDGKPLLETSDKETSGLMELEAGKAYPVQIEYTDFGWWGSYYLHWIPPGEADEVPIPCECLFPTRQSLPKKSK